MRVERLTVLGDADRATLLALWVRAWAATMPAIDFEARRTWLSDHLDALLAAGAVLLIARGEAAAGSLLGFLTLDHRSGVVDQLAVDPAAAGRGCGRALMAEAKRLRPEGLRLSVNTANGRALAFYRAAGFVVTGESLNARSGLPVLLMTWPAPP